MWSQKSQKDSVQIFSLRRLVWVSWQQERAGTDTETTTKKKHEIDFERLAVHLFEGGPQEDAAWPSNWGDYTENNVIMLKASANTHPKIAEGLVTNIWLDSTLYSAKSRKILAWINWPFVVYFNKSYRFMSRNIIKSDFNLNRMYFYGEGNEEMTCLWLFPTCLGVLISLFIQIILRLFTLWDVYQPAYIWKHWMPDRLSLLDKDVHINALPLHKLLHKICKCNHNEWPHVALCGSEKQAFHKTGLLHLISLSTAPLKDWKWELALPWVSRRWLRYLAIETEMAPETEGMGRKKRKKRKNSPLRAAESSCFISSHKVPVCMISVSSWSDLCSPSSWEEKLSNKQPRFCKCRVPQLCKSAFFLVFLFISW